MHETHYTRQEALHSCKICAPATFGKTKTTFCVSILLHNDIPKGGVVLDDIVGDGRVGYGLEVAAGAFYLYSLGVAVIRNFVIAVTFGLSDEIDMPDVRAASLIVDAVVVHMVYEGRRQALDAHLEEPALLVYVRENGLPYLLPAHIDVIDSDYMSPSYSTIPFSRQTQRL